MWTVILLLGSNVFMTFAWYRHLRNQATSPLWIAIVTSWGIAFFEYCLAVPANRIGTVDSVPVIDPSVGPRVLDAHVLWAHGRGARTELVGRRSIGMFPSILQRGFPCDVHVARGEGDVHDPDC